MQPMLLWTDNHAGTHEAHKGNDLVGGEAVTIDEIGADETAGAAEPGFAMDGDTLLFDSDSVVGEIYESSHQR